MHKFGVRSLAFGSGFRQRAHPPAQRLKFVGDLTAGVTPVPIPNTEVKPRRTDGTARESVWERRSLPALDKGHILIECGLCLFQGASGFFLRYFSGTRRHSLYASNAHAITDSLPRGHSGSSSA